MPIASMNTQPIDTEVRRKPTFPFQFNQATLAPLDPWRRHIFLLGSSNDFPVNPEPGRIISAINYQRRAQSQVCMSPAMGTLSLAIDYPSQPPSNPLLTLAGCPLVLWNLLLSQLLLMGVCRAVHREQQGCMAPGVLSSCRGH